MSDAEFRIDPLTGACVVVTPWRQHRPNRPAGRCPFCPGGLEAPDGYDVKCIRNRWPGLPGGRHEVVLHSPDHDSSFPELGVAGTARVVELWSQRTAALGSRADAGYVFIFENRGRQIGATIDHPHSQIMAFTGVPPIPAAELSQATCGICRDHDDRLTVTRHPQWLARVPWAPSWPYEMVISPVSHVGDLPAAGRQLRTGLAAVLVDCLTRVQRLFGTGAPYMLWIHQRPTGGQDRPIAHLHLHLAPLLRGPGMIRHLAAAEMGAGVFFDPVDPPAAAAQLKGDRLASAGMTQLMAWLVPAAGPGRDQLAATITRLAARHGTPPFSPHVTVAGRISATEAAAAETLSSLAAGVAPFDVTLDAVGHEQAYFRSLYLRAVPSPQLLALDRAARRAWELALPPYRPHLSLLYSDFTEERKQAIIAGLRIPLPLTVRCDALELWAAGQQGVAGWRRVARQPLVTG